MANLRIQLLCLAIGASLLALTCAQITSTPSSVRQDNRGRYNPYYNDQYYNNRYYKNRDYYNNRQYYDSLYKNYNPSVAAPGARIISQDMDLQQDGSYSYAFETENGIHAEERGVPVKVGTNEQSELVEGSYSFVTPDGLRVIVKYTADANGYHPVITYDGNNAERFARVQNPADTVITGGN